MTIGVMAPESFTRQECRLLCPMCAARDVFDVDPAEHGELLYCPECGHSWRPDPPRPIEPVGRRPFDRFRPSDPFALNS
jgi:hypothetical protein